MNRTRDAVDASYEACRRSARRSGSSFATSFLGLPKAKRRAMDVLYALMRHTDDLADDPPGDLPPAEALRQWRAALSQALQGDHDIDTALPGREMLPAVADVVYRYRIPPEYLRAVIDGVEIDLKRNRFQTFGELEDYCEKVASAVGLACIHIWGFTGRQALEPARKCGIALQLTNILRDLKEDAQRDRVYLPLDDLKQCDYSVDDLKAGVADGRFVRLMDYEIGRAEWFYRKGSELLDWLEPDGRRTFGMMMATYRALLRRIKRRPEDVLRRRIGVSRPGKLWIATRWTLLPPRVAALL